MCVFVESLMLIVGMVVSNADVKVFCNGVYALELLPHSSWCTLDFLLREHRFPCAQALW